MASSDPNQGSISLAAAASVSGFSGVGKTFKQKDPPKSVVLLQPNQQAHDVYMALKKHIDSLQLPKLEGVGKITLEVEWHEMDITDVKVVQHLLHQTTHKRGQ